MGSHAQRDNELFDVVDDGNEIIGRDTRANVHRLGLKHRAAHVLVFDRAGKLFLQKRSLAKDTGAGQWDSSAAGHLDAGEGYDAAIVRELEEELGINVAAAPERVLFIEACEATGQEFVWVYRLEHEGPFRLNPAEIETGRWFAPAEVERWIEETPEELTSGFILIWRRLRSRTL